ncbi:hypothetical protein ABIA38_004372 [Embleya sp. AB8]
MCQLTMCQLTMCHGYHGYDGRTRRRELSVRNATVGDSGSRAAAIGPERVAANAAAVPA